MDVTDRQVVEGAAAQVSAQLGSSTLAGLVNNAGVAVPGPLLHLPLEEYRRQLEVNLVAPLSVTQVFASLLGADLARRGPAGRIINIGSTAGKVTGYWPADGLSFGPCLCDAGFDALTQDLSFKFSEEGQHAGHGAPSRRGHVERFRERYQLGNANRRKAGITGVIVPS
jgi:NAD(P)-dependent dehydrogenase (short-subunit alcohol dehydrogenase family)